MALRSMKAPGTAYDDPRARQGPAAGPHGDYVAAPTRTTAACTSTPASRTRRSTWRPRHSAATRGRRPGRIWYETLRDPGLRPNTGFRRFAEADRRRAGPALRCGQRRAAVVADAWATVGLAVPAVSVAIRINWIAQATAARTASGSCRTAGRESTEHASPFSGQRRDRHFSRSRRCTYDRCRRAHRRGSPTVEELVDEARFFELPRTRPRHVPRRITRLTDRHSGRRSKSPVAFSDRRPGRFRRSSTPARADARPR